MSDLVEDKDFCARLEFQCRHSAKLQDKKQRWNITYIDSFKFSALLIYKLLSAKCMAMLIITKYFTP